MNVKVEFRRHGECVDYRKDVLTLKGKEDAEKLAGRICDFGKVLSASSGRAIQTAEILSKGKEVETSPFLDEIPEIDQEEEFSPKAALQDAKEALKFIYNKILEDGKENTENLSVLIITSGGLLGVIELYLEGKTPKTENDLRLFNPLNGIRLSMQVEIIS